MKLHAAQLFDAKGRFLREETGATWSLTGLKGTVDRTARSRSPRDPVEQAGIDQGDRRQPVAAKRARASSHPLPWTETFESYADGAVPPGWVNAVAGKFAVATLDGQKVLEKAPDDTIFKRIRAFIGPADWSNYTVEADVRGDDEAPADGRHRASPRSATRWCSTATRSS